MAHFDKEVLEAALIGYEHQKIEIDEKIEQLRAHLRGHVAPAAVAASKSKARIPRSAAVRAKMAAAQQRRWAAARGESMEAVPAEMQTTEKASAKKRGTKKRAMSAEARERISAAQRKRWANAAKAAKGK